MKSLSKYIKEKDTDTRLVEEIDDLVYNLIQNDDMYNSMGGKSQTTVEAIGKFKDTLLMILQAIVGGEGFSGGTSLVEKEYTLEGTDNSGNCFYGYITEYQGKNIVQIPDMSPNGTLLDISKKDKGRYLLFTHNTLLSGVLPCTYYYYIDDDCNESERKNGVIEFDNTSQNIYLVTDEEFTENKSTLFVNASGMLLEYNFLG